MIQEHIKKPLAEEILFGKLKDGGIVRVLVKEENGEKELGFEYIKPDAPIRPRGPDGTDSEDFDSDDPDDPEAATGLDAEGGKSKSKAKKGPAQACRSAPPWRQAWARLKPSAEGAARLALGTSYSRQKLSCPASCRASMFYGRR